MEKDKILSQLVTISDELQTLCAVLKQNAILSKNTGIMLKRHIARMNALLLDHGIEKLPDVVEENALLLEQNVILLEQRETDLKTLLRLQEKLDVLHASPILATDLVQRRSGAGGGPDKFERETLI